MAWDAMEHGWRRALVRTILEHAEDYPWKMQDLGLMGLWLDDRREYRLHVWDPDRGDGVPPIHDHPFDFVSVVIAGELTNTRYTEDASGTEYSRVRYSPPDETARRTDTVRLSGSAETFCEGDSYRQLAPELHDSRQLPGTVTIIRRAFEERAELTVCLPPDSPWVSGQSRLATIDEVKSVTTKALSWF